jgi:hypothetical protein
LKIYRQRKDIAVFWIGESKFVENSLFIDLVLGIETFKLCSLKEVLLFDELEGIFDVHVNIRWKQKSEFLKKCSLTVSKHLRGRKLQGHGFVDCGKLHLSSVRNKTLSYKYMHFSKKSKKKLMFSL